MSTSPTRRVKATFAVPALLGLAGEVIVVDGKAYVKTTITGPAVPGHRRPTRRVDPSDTPAKIIDNLGDLLTQPGVEPVKGDDVSLRHQAVLHGQRRPDRRGPRARSPARWPAACRST